MLPSSNSLLTGLYRLGFALLLVPGMVGVGSAQAASTHERPNVVFILMDNTGWGDFSAYGGSTPTPRIDEIAQAGVKLTNYTVQAECVPTRAAIMSARLPTRSGAIRVPPVRGMKYGLAPWEYTLGELFSDAGYQTALMGKWHLGDTAGRYPTDQGFDSWYGIANSSGEAGYVDSPLFSESGLAVPKIFSGIKGQPVEVVKTLDLNSKVYLDEEIAEKSAAFITQAAKSDSPFFLFVGFTSIHPPATLHPDFLDEDGKVTYAGVLTEMDMRTGQILDALAEAGVEENTIVVFSSDNATAPYGDLNTGSNGPFRGHFFNQPYEGSYRVSAMVRWPGNIPAGAISDEMFTALDWMPTLAAMTNEHQRIPTDRPIDGINIADHLLGKQAASGRDYVIFHGLDGSLMSVKWQDFKIIFREMEERDRPIQTLAYPAIYNLKDDPTESRNMTYWKIEDTWISAPVAERVVRFKISENVYPNIETGEDFDGYSFIMTAIRKQLIKFKLGENFPDDGDE